MSPSAENSAPGDSLIIPKLLQEQPPAEFVHRGQQDMIMSASGWRKIFAASGDEEDSSGDVRLADILLAGIVGRALADFLPGHLQKPPADICLAVACDSRPTGGLIADALMRAALAQAMGIRYLFIAAAPEIMSYSFLCAEVDAFAYISASHNPIGHNGFKFGLNDGGVMPARLSYKLRDLFLKHLAKSQDAVYIALTDQSISRQMEQVFADCKAHKAEALRSYQRFSTSVIADSADEGEQDRIRRQINSALKKRPVGILGELNGSARGLSIDRSFFEGLGAQIELINDRPGQIVHRIIPEGESLHLCRDELAKRHRKNPAYVLGYVPDNDGDRGNIVYINAGGQAAILEAQTVFALAALAESAWLEYSGQLRSGDGTAGAPAATIVVNGPTSMRIDAIARAFGMDCLRAEVGEANVTSLAGRLRAEGRLVRIMGEGSNGGSIIHPAAVRDPLNSVASIIKLLTLRETADDHRPGLFQICCQRLGRQYSPDFTLDDLLAALPVYTTISASDDIAIMHIRSKNQKKLKTVWEDIFLKDWEKFRAELSRRWGLESWVEINTEGMDEKIGFGPKYRSGEERGGLKILFSNGAGQAEAFIWMRGSGTEDLFRVLADVRGDRPELAAHLIQWQRNMIEQADKKS